MEILDTRYAKTPDGVYIAYQVAGEGPVDLAWALPVTGPLLRALAGLVPGDSPRPAGHGAFQPQRRAAESRDPRERPAMGAGYRRVGAAGPRRDQRGGRAERDAGCDPTRARPLDRVAGALSPGDVGARLPLGREVRVSRARGTFARSLGNKEYGEGWAEAEAAAGLTLSPEHLRMAG